MPLEIKHLRVSRGLSLAECAEAMGVTSPSYWAWENGRASPKPERLPMLAHVLGCSIEDMFPPVPGPNYTAERRQAQ